VNERGDLILWDRDDNNRNKGSSGESERIGENEGGQDRKWKKMSPSPALPKDLPRSLYKIVAQRAYHHGTMLISSDLGSLGTYLRSKSVRRISSSDIGEKPRGRPLNWPEYFLESCTDSLI
jgi:hypothetical protein